MDFEGIQNVNSEKLVSALRIVNQQLALSNSQVKKDLYLSEQRFNEVNDLLLGSRQENKALREMVRKLKDQLSIITKVMISVKDQTDKLFETIDHPHVITEEYERNRQPRAQLVYERMRLDNPPYVHEAVIQEEDEMDESVSQPESADVSTNVDESSTPLAINDQSASACGQLIENSPLVQRLKRPSKSTSFDESFETIERERVFKFSRLSRERRQLYAGLSDEADTLREVHSLEQSKKSIASSVMDLEDTIRASSINMSPVGTEQQNSSCSAATQREQFTLRDDMSINPDRCILKKTVSETMLSTICGAVAVNGNCESRSASFEDLTELCTEDTIANASCSTPVNKGQLAKSSSNKTRPLAGVQKMKSDTALNMKRQPMVLVQALTEENVRSLVRQTNRAAGIATGSKDTKSSEFHPGSSIWDGTNLEPSSSTENLSVISNDSGRPRRRAAPKTLREPSLIVKLRRT